MDRAWSLSITGYQFPHDSHERIIEVCRHAGFSGVEANALFVEGKTPAEIAAVREQYQAAGLNLDSFHLPMDADADVAGFYETQRRQAVAQTQYLIEGAARLGSRVLIMHPSTCRLAVEIEGLDRYLLYLGKSLEAVLPHAEKHGVTIALENMLPGPDGQRFGSAPEHFTRFAEKFAHPHLGFCLDTGHALVAGGHDGPAAFFQAMADHLVAFHLQDNAGDRDSHLAPGKGLIDWRVVFDGMQRIKYAAPACIEAPPFAPGPHGSYSLAAWKRLVAETWALADNPTS